MALAKPRNMKDLDTIKELEDNNIKENRETDLPQDGSLPEHDWQKMRKTVESLAVTQETCHRKQMELFELDDQLSILARELNEKEDRLNAKAAILAFLAEGHDLNELLSKQKEGEYKLKKLMADMARVQEKLATAQIQLATKDREISALKQKIAILENVLSERPTVKPKSVNYPGKPDVNDSRDNSQNTTSTDSKTSLVEEQSKSEEINKKSLLTLHLPNNSPAPGRGGRRQSEVVSLPLPKLLATDRRQSIAVGVRDGSSVVRGNQTIYSLDSFEEEQAGSRMCILQ